MRYNQDHFSSHVALIEYIFQERIGQRKYASNDSYQTLSCGVSWPKTRPKLSVLITQWTVGPPKINLSLLIRAKRKRHHEARHNPILFLMGYRVTWIAGWKFTTLVNYFTWAARDFFACLLLQSISNLQTGSSSSSCLFSSSSSSSYFSSFFLFFIFSFNYFI